LELNAAAGVGAIAPSFVGAVEAKNETEEGASNKGGATPRASDAEAMVASIPVIDIDRAESPNTLVEAEAKIREKSAPDAEAGVDEALRPLNVQAGSSNGNAKTSSSRPFDNFGADDAGPSNRPFDNAGADNAEPSNRSLPDCISIFRQAQGYKEALVEERLAKPIKKTVRDFILADYLG